MRPVYVQGCSISRTWGDGSRSLTELIFDCTTSALDRAGLRARDVDAVVLSAHDLVDGRGLTNMVTAPAAAAYLKDETRLGDDGAWAFILGDARVRSGSVETCLVAAWGRASEGPQDHIAHALFDPFMARPLAMTELAVSGLRATRALGDFPGYTTHRDDAGIPRRRIPREPLRTPSAPWPLRNEELPLWADVVAVAVLSSRPGPVSILGAGMSTEPFDIGDRDLTAFPALRSASARAMSEAGVTAENLAVVEVDGLTLFDEALATEAVGVATSGDGMHVLGRPDLVNPDGGSAAGYCAPAMGLVRICTAVTRLYDRPEAYAIATGSSVVAGQTSAAVVLGAES